MLPLEQNNMCIIDSESEYRVFLHLIFRMPLQYHQKFPQQARCQLLSLEKWSPQYFSRVLDVQGTIGSKSQHFGCQSRFLSVYFLSYFLKIALSLVQSTYQQSSCLHKFLIFFLRGTLANQNSVIIREHYAFNTMKFIYDSFKKFCALSSHKFRSKILKWIVIIQMSKNSAIEIILRVRPNKNTYKGFTINKEQNRAQFFIPKQQEEGYINNKEQKRSFQFNQIFDMDTKQEKVFDKVAKDVVDSALQGFNGTVFAYGQTGSGKTFTMTGGSGSYQDRGLIPRTLSYIFNECKARSQNIKVNISYLQIYQSIGYDLLAVQNLTKTLFDLPKVQPREGPNGELQLNNLQSFHCNTQQDALNYLFIGDTNRVVSKTPKNDQSTRSHCIFIINIQSSKPGSDIKTVASVHLVDLSGSQRIQQTGVQGLLQREAIDINLGLHYLQRVIVQLNQKARGQNVHISYRDSLMTMVLRDSLGGNCKTRMIATMSSKPQDIMQSLATCKFAQRVALIKNDLLRNETVDPGVIIARLKKENAQLKAEIALLKGQDAKEELDKYEIEDCHKMVDEYIQSTDPSAALILSDRLKINQCFYYFKNILKKGGSRQALQQRSNLINNDSKRMQRSYVPNQNQDGGRAAEQIKRLKLLIQQRDNQLALLVSLIKKRSGQGNEVVIPVRRGNQEENLLKSVVKEKPMHFPNQQQTKIESQKMQSRFQESKFQSSKMPQRSLMEADAEEIEKMLVKPVNLTSEQMLDQAQAFQQFRRSYRRHQAMQKNMGLLQEKMSKGKELGKVMNQIRSKIQFAKQKLQNLKRQNAVNALVEGRQIQDPVQQRLQNEIISLKQKSKPLAAQLKTLKNDIESIQVLQKKQMQQLKKDFTKWYMLKQKQRSNLTQQIDSSLLTSNIKDKQVLNHLQSFLAARDQIRKR